VVSRRPDPARGVPCRAEQDNLAASSLFLEDAVVCFMHGSFDVRTNVRYGVPPMDGDVRDGITVRHISMGLLSYGTALAESLFTLPYCLHICTLRKRDRF